MLPPQLPNVSIQRLDSRSRPADGVDAAAKICQGAMGRSPLRGNPQRSNGASNIGEGRVEAVGVQVFGVLWFLGGAGVVKSRYLLLGKADGRLSPALFCFR